MTDNTDTAQLNTDADDQTITVIAVSAAVGAGLVAAGLAGLAALTYFWLIKRKRHKHGLFHHSYIVWQAHDHSEPQHLEYVKWYSTCLLQAPAVVVEMRNSKFSGESCVSLLPHSHILLL